MSHPHPVPDATPERLHALDAARALALLLGIVLHATMSFFFIIPARDVSQSTTLGVTFYVIHIFRMSLFYLIAGFFAHLMFHRRGTRGFLKDRAKRIVVPMIGGWVLLAPPTIAAVAWGLGRSFPDGPPAGAASLAVPAGFPLTQLWFLYYLCLFYLLALALRWCIVAADRPGRLRRGIDRIIRGVLPSYLAPVLLAAPLFLVLYNDPAWAVWFGLPSPDTGFAPQLPAMTGFGTAFVLGWLVHRQVELLGVWRRQWAVNLALAAGLTVYCLTLVGPTPSENAFTVAGPAWHRLAYTAAYTAAVWFWTFGVLGVALRYFSGVSAARRYVADASYWFYLAHLPIVFGLQVLMMNWPLWWMIKFPLILAITLGVLLLSYQYLVRPTLIGEVLNGRKYSRRKRDTARPGADAAARAGGEGIVAPVAVLEGVSKRFGQAIALDGLSLVVRPSELLAVLGPNGAGKTTAIGLWLGTLEPDDGVVSVMGGSPFDVQSRLGVGVMMQEVTFAPMLTAREIVALTATYYRDPLTVEEALTLTGTAGLADRRYGKLSAGQKRQVQFAAAVCGRPSLLFLDEPTVGLDVQAREAMWRAIRRLLGEGCSIVLTTHYLEEAEALASRVAVLAKGKLVAEGSVDEMRALVTRKRISCLSTLEVDEVRRWPGVVEAARDGQLVQVTAFDAEAVVRRLLAADEGLSQLEVKQATLAEAFTEITREAA